MARTKHAHAEHTPGCKACASARHRATPAGRMANRRSTWKAYGMDPDAAEAAWLRADACEACGGPKEVVDHDHQTGQVRGVLCQQCNRAAGHVYDDPERLRALADYLETRSA